MPNRNCRKIATATPERHGFRAVIERQRPDRRPQDPRGWRRQAINGRGAGRRRGRMASHVRGSMPVTATDGLRSCRAASRSRRPAGGPTPGGRAGACPPTLAPVLMIASGSATIVLSRSPPEHPLDRGVAQVRPRRAELDAQNAQAPGRACDHRSSVVRRLSFVRTRPAVAVSGSKFGMTGAAECHVVPAGRRIATALPVPGLRSHRWRAARQSRALRSRLRRGCHHYLRQGAAGP